MVVKKSQSLKKSATSKEDFLNTAMDLFSKKGYFDISVDDIVKKAGRSKGGFYHHYQSKEALFHEIFEKILELQMTRFSGKIESGVTVREALESLMESSKDLVKTPEQMKNIVGIFVVALHDPETLVLVRAFYKKAVMMFEKMLTVGKERGELEFDMPVSELAEMLFCSSRGVLIMDVLIYGGKHVFERMGRYLLYEIKMLEKKK